MTTLNHPLYGEFTINKELCLYGHKNNGNIEKLDKYTITLIENGNHIIKGKRGVLKEKYGKLTLSQETKNPTGYSIYHIFLASAFPHITPSQTIDHINNDFNDNRIQNLCWMTRSENSKKGQTFSVDKIKSNDGRNGKEIQMFRNNNLIQTFKSVESAARFLIENHCENNPQQKTVASKITRNLTEPSRTAYGFVFVYSCPTSLESEDWKPFAEKYKVSNKGRVIGYYNNIMTQQKNRNGSKYSSVSINGRYKYVHHLVWKAFNGDVPENKEILHNDSAPLIDGMYRNWLEDLRLGTRSENMKEFHANKTL